MSYFIAVGGDRKGPFDKQDLVANGLRWDTLVWCEGMNDWLPASSVPDLHDILPVSIPPGSSGGTPPPIHPVGYQTVGFDKASINSKKTAAGLCGILLGALGVHKFILGYTTAGVIMLLVTVLSCGLASWIMSIIGIIEGVMYISKSEEQFYQEYILQKKEWF